MAFPKVKLSDDSGNAVGVTSNALDVNIAGGATIDIGDVDMFLDGGTAVLGGTGAVAAGVLRVTVATDDPHWGTVGTAADSDGTAHGQLGYIGLQTLNINSNLTSVRSDLSSTNYLLGEMASTTGAQYAEGDGGVLADGVRNDTLATLVSVDHDHAPFQVNAIGGLYVTGSEVENAAVQSEPLLMGGRYDSSARTLGNGDAGAVALNASGHMIMDVVDGGQLDTIIDTLETTLTAIETDQAAIEALLITIDSDTNHIKSATYEDDSDWVNSSSRHMLVGGLYQSSMQTVTDGDLGPFQIDSNGQLKVALSATDNAVLDAIDTVLDTIKVDTEAIETAVELIDDAIYADDDDFSLNSSKGIAIMGYSGANPITSGDIGVISVDEAGQVRTVTNLAEPDTFAMLDIDNAAEVLSDTIGVLSDCVEVFLQADESNSGYVIVGDGDVADNRGMKLNPGDTLILNAVDTRSINLWGSAANQNVRCMLTRSII